MFQDEARFGRINDPKRCWSPKRTRPTVGKQIIREYTYAYGAVSPRDGAADFQATVGLDGQVLKEQGIHCALEALCLLKI